MAKKIKNALTNGIPPMSIDDQLELLGRFRYAGSTTSSFTTIVDLSTIAFNGYDMAKVLVKTIKSAYNNGEITELLLRRDSNSSWIIVNTVLNSQWGTDIGWHNLQISGNNLQIQRGGNTDNDFAAFVDVLRGID